MFSIIVLPFCSRILNFWPRGVYLVVWLMFVHVTLRFVCVCVWECFWVFAKILNFVKNFVILRFFIFEFFFCIFLFLSFLSWTTPRDNYPNMAESFCLNFVLFSFICRFWYPKSLCFWILLAFLVLLLLLLLFVVSTICGFLNGKIETERTEKYLVKIQNMENICFELLPKCVFYLIDVLEK